MMLAAVSNTVLILMSRLIMSCHQVRHEIDKAMLGSCIQY